MSFSVPFWENPKSGIAVQLPLRAGLEHRSPDYGEAPGLPATASADAESTLCVAAACIQTVRTEVAAALVAAHQALADNAFLAVMTDGDVAAFDEVEFAPVNQGSVASEVQRDHGNSIQSWKLLPVAST
jgi:hypothetical protein